MNKYNCECGKTYKHRQSLHFHKKNCNKSKDKLLIYTRLLETKLLEFQDELYKRNRSLEEENHRLRESLNQTKDIANKMVDITNKMVDNSNSNSKNLYINIIDMLATLENREKNYLKLLINK